MSWYGSDVRSFLQETKHRFFNLSPTKQAVAVFFSCNGKRKQICAESDQGQRISARNRNQTTRTCFLRQVSHLTCFHYWDSTGAKEAIKFGKSALSSYQNHVDNFLWAFLNRMNQQGLCLYQTLPARILSANIRSSIWHLRAELSRKICDALLQIWQRKLLPKEKETERMFFQRGESRDIGVPDRISAFDFGKRRGAEENATPCTETQSP